MRETFDVSKAYLINQGHGLIFFNSYAYLVINLLTLNLDTKDKIIK